MLSERELIDALPALKRCAKGKWKLDPDMADDLVQETCLRAWRFREYFRGGSAEAWLVVMMGRIFFTEKRRLARQNGSIFPEPEEQGAPQDAFVLAREVAAQIARHDSLGDAMMTDVAAGYSYGELAEQHSLTIPAVRARLFDSRAALRKWAALVLLLFVSLPAFAHDPNGDPTVNDWLMKQHNQVGWWCCDGNDVTYLDSGQWGIDDKGYWALFDGGKTRVADHTLLDPSGGPNPTGKAILWSIGGAVRCFAPGTES